jgi:hypothetical protein
MVGASNLTCRTDGSWDTSAPSCGKVKKRIRII